MLHRLVFAFPVLLWAQEPGTVVGFGYRAPANVVTSAPGQVATLAVTGVRTRIAGGAWQPPASPQGLPTTALGFTVRLQQGDRAWSLRLAFIQQSGALTTFAIRIPFELEPGRAASIEVREEGVLVARTALNAVSDDIHVMNTCDETGAFYGVASAVPAGECVPVVVHADGKLVTPANPAKAGETLVVWSYGLGALDRAPAEAYRTIEDVPLAVQPLLFTFSGRVPGKAAYQRLGQAAPVFAGMVGEGFYEVHAKVPETLEALAPCGQGFGGNLRILLSGPGSSGTAEICVAAQ